MSKRVEIELPHHGLVTDKGSIDGWDDLSFCREFIEAVKDKGFYCYTGLMAEVRNGRTEVLSPSLCQTAFLEHVSFVGVLPKTKNGVPFAEILPDSRLWNETARMFLASEPVQGLPKLNGIVKTPFLYEDAAGHLQLSPPGYDPVSGYYVDTEKRPDQIGPDRAIALTAGFGCGLRLPDAG